MKTIFIFLLILSAVCASSQNVGIGTTTPVTKLNIVGSGSNPAFPGTTSTAIFRIGVGTAEGIDFGKMGSPPYSGWMQAGLNGVIPDPLSLQPMGGNVGIGTVSPSEKLDVTGSINVTGTIKANGVDGTGGQVLMKNSSGNLAWGDMCQYKNFVTLSSPGAFSTWNVPAGVTKILIEIWGAGGGGNLLAGGGGGGYVKAYFSVSAGDAVQYYTGIGGTGATSASATSGQNSAIQIGTINLNATGGQGALFISATNGQAGPGGAFIVTPASFNNYIGLRARPGESQERKYFQYDATTYYESGKAGRGGNAANTDNTGGLGQTYLYNTTGSTLVFRNGNPSLGAFPGGGGASGVQYGISTVGGGTGADGTVIIHY